MGLSLYFMFQHQSLIEVWSHVCQPKYKHKYCIIILKQYENGQVKKTIKDSLNK